MKTMLYAILFSVMVGMALSPVSSYASSAVANRPGARP